ncbi:hypothetical protein BTI679_21220 [Bacillus wiedmannii]|nr:hypothetical protein BTI679_21220 [Bacillus wiedmannii]
MSKKEMVQNGIKQVFYEEEWYPPCSWPAHRSYF